MAEFCLECYNKLNALQLTLDDVVLDSELDLCEGCGELKHTIIEEK